MPIVFMTGWQFSGYAHRGVTYIGSMYRYLGQRGLWEGSTRIRTAVATLTYLGGTILPFPFLFWKMGWQWKGALTFAGLGIAVAVVNQRLAGYSLLETIFFIACFGGAVVAVVWALTRGIAAICMSKRTTDDVFLILWFLGMLAACVVAFYSGSARYLLPACPPLLLLLIRADEQRTTARKLPRGYYASLFTAQLLLGLCLAHSDYEFAGTGRREARDLESQYLRDRQPFLFSAEWGFRRYMTNLGGEPMAEDTTGSPGTLVVKSSLALGKTFDNDFERSLELVDRRIYRIRSPFRLLHAHSHAGFWSDGWGVLPFWFSFEPLDELSVYRAKKD
jgi:hypothetical protein